MGASLALAAAGCDGPDEFGHPLHARSRGVVLDDAAYATVLDLDGLGRGVLVRTRAGHPVKIEGNPAHPASLGATDIFAEAAVLSLHDPERSRRVRLGGRLRPVHELDAALAAMRAELLPRRGAGLRVLTGPVSSPTLVRLLGELLAAFPEAAWHIHDPLSDAAAMAGAEAAWGQPVATLPDLARASAVLCLGADPLGMGPAQLRLSHDWSAGRAAARADGWLPAVIVAESSPSLTGARASQLLPLAPDAMEPFTRAVAAALAVPGLAGSGSHPAADAVAAQLRAAGTAALVLAGPGQPPAVHALAHAMNAALGAPVRHIRPPLARAAGMRPLVADMEAGRVTHLVMLDGNPAYTSPAALGFAAAMARVPATLHIGFELDETAHLCRWHAPLPHPLESWGDSLAFDGTPAIRQPATVPLVPEARGEAEVLTALLGAPATAQEAVAATWRAVWGHAFEVRWAAALESGVAGEASAPLSLALRPGWDSPSPPAPAASLTALFVPDPSVRAGDWAGNAWLQEMPRPLTKIVWGNAALLAPATAAALGLAPGDEVELELGGRRVLAGCWPLPGHAPDCVTLPLGGGRRAAGPVGTGRGFDAYRVRPADGAFSAEGLTLRPTGRRAGIVATGSRHALDPASVVRVVAPGATLSQPGPLPSLHEPWVYDGNAWGMSVDLDACIGCNACAVACQSENNVPVVGPEEVAHGREMHWLRIDRYCHGTGDAPAVTFQPVPCMQCEQAPCEPVCPVNASVHDHEGLNLQVYNRCIGTRTCSNGCPYKVRRFNWTDHRRALDTAGRNPEVPLRPRGVMEKCTYCVHRIADARARQGVEQRPLRDGEVRTACQEACPTRAITFGNLNDPDSAAARRRRDGRTYAMLGELGTRPRTTYLARVAPDGGDA